VTSFQLQVRRQEAESRAATRSLLRGTVGGRVARNIIDRFSTGLWSWWTRSRRGVRPGARRDATGPTQPGEPFRQATGQPGHSQHLPQQDLPTWTLGTVKTILANPRYTGRQVWNRLRTDRDLTDPADISLGPKQVQRWNLPDGWVISSKPAHEALVSEADFIAAKDVNAACGLAPCGDPAVLQKRRYPLAGLLACATCGRRLESAWSNGKPAYWCRLVGAGTFSVCCFPPKVPWFS
jgi:hypothetical protein